MKKSETICSINTNEVEVTLIHGIANMVEGTIALGMPVANAMNSVITALIILATNDKSPEKFLESIADAITSDAATDAIKFYKKQRNKLNGK